AIKLGASIEKRFVVAITNQLIQFLFGQLLFIQITGSEGDFQLEQETSCFATRASSGLLIKDKEFAGHEFSFWRVSTAAQQDQFPRTSDLCPRPEISRTRRLAPAANSPRPCCAPRGGNSRPHLPRHPASAGSREWFPWESIRRPRCGIAHIPRPHEHPPAKVFRHGPGALSARADLSPDRSCHLLFLNPVLL